MSESEQTKPDSLPEDADVPAGVHPHRSGLLRHSILLFLATQISNVANSGFQMVMGWGLSAEEYSILIALLNIILITSAPVQALRMVIAHYSARFIQAGHSGDVRRLLVRWSGVTAAVAASVLLVLFLTHHQIMEFLHIDRAAPVLAMGVVFALSLFMTVMMGTLHGLQAFRWMVAATVGWSTVRLVIGAALVFSVLPTAVSGLVAQFIAIVAFIGIALTGLRAKLKNPLDSGGDLPAMAGYYWQSCLVLLSFSILMYADLIMVRRLLIEDAGRFAYAATIGRSVIFLPMPIAIALFPKVTSAGDSHAEDRRSLIRGVAYSLLVIGGAVGACLLLPELALLVLFGLRDADPEQVLMVRVVVLAMCPLGLAYLLMNYEMAQKRFGMLVAGLVCVVVYVGGVFLFHESIWQVILVLAISSVAYLTLLAAVAVASVRRR